MNNPKDFKLPRAESSFEISDWPYPPNVDPAFILRYLKDDLIQPVIGAYLTYMAKVANLQADVAKARAEFHTSLAKMHG